MIEPVYAAGQVAGTAAISIIYRIKKIL